VRRYSGSTPFPMGLAGFPFIDATKSTQGARYGGREKDQPKACNVGNQLEMLDDDDVASCHTWGFPHANVTQHQIQKT